MSLLFDAPVLPGLAIRDDAITELQEHALIEALEALDLAPFRFQQWTGNRKTQSFGWRYDFENSSFVPVEPIPDWLGAARAAAATIAKADQADFVHVLIARYDPGAGIGWHRDRDVFDKVAGLSLGSDAVLRFRQRRPDGFRRARLPVPPRSLYLLSGEARHDWEHSIAPGERLRFSITFRTLSAKGRAIAQRQRSS